MQGLKDPMGEASCARWWRKVSTVLGEVIIAAPFVGMTDGFWNEPAHYRDTYWRQRPGLWSHGDLLLDGESAVPDPRAFGRHAEITGTTCRAPATQTDRRLGRSVLSGLPSGDLSSMENPTGPAMTR